MLITPEGGRPLSVLLAISIPLLFLILRGKNLLHARIFYAVHSTTLLLFLSYQSTLLNYLNVEVFLLIWLSTISYCTGSLLKFKQVTPAENDICRVRKINNIAFIFYVFAFIYELQQAGFVPPILASDKLSAYIEFPKPIVHYLVVLSIPITIIYSKIAFEKPKASQNELFPIFVMLILNVSMMARAVFMTQIFSIFIIYMTERNIKIKPKSYIKLAIIGMGLVTLIGTIRTGGEVRALLDMGGLEHWPTFAIPFAWPYLYYTTSLENFRFLYTINHEHFYGALSLGRPLLTLFFVKSYLPNITEDGLSAGGFNTAGYYADAYYDFGWFMPVYTLALGIIGTHLSRSKKLYCQLFLPYFLYALFTSSVNNYFDAFFSFFYLIYLYFIDKKTRIRRITT